MPAGFAACAARQARPRRAAPLSRRILRRRKNRGAPALRGALPPYCRHKPIFCTPPFWHKAAPFSGSEFIAKSRYPLWQGRRPRRSPYRPSSRACRCFPLIFASIASAISLLSSRNLLAFSLPCPRRWPSYENHEPLFSTMPSSTSEVDKLACGAICPCRR